MTIRLLKLFIGLTLLTSCGARVKMPFETESARIGETSTKKNPLLDSVQPVEPVVVGVYKFRDQTGQYKQVENGSSWSTAVTQGATTMLLKALEDSPWFSPLERENVSNLLNERQIIRSTRNQYEGGNKTEADVLPPLLFAGVILEGGIISYDSNIRTGGMGLRYFGTGGSTEYREDRITVYLRAVSTSNGKILKTIYVSKTILSQAISANVFKYVDLQRLLEAEVGITRNEPKHLAVKEAIDKCVEGMVIEGIIDGLWPSKGGTADVVMLKQAYQKEKEDAEKTKLYNRVFEDRRSRSSLGISAGASQINGDYSDQDFGYNYMAEYRLQFNNPKVNWNLKFGVFETENINTQEDELALTIDTNLEYMMMPYEQFSPYIHAGFGVVSDQDFNTTYPKVQVGLGLEYLATDFMGIRIYGEQNVTFTDELDGLVQGNRDDYFWRFGIGLNFYIGR